MVFGAGALGSTGAVMVFALLPCSFRLMVLASLIVWVVALVASSALMILVPNCFKPSNAMKRVFTTLLKLVFLVITSARAKLNLCRVFGVLLVLGRFWRDCRRDRSRL